MDLYTKISILGPGAQYDTCGPRDFGQTTNIPGVYHAQIDGGHVCRLFKVLQTNSCQNNCRYCAFRTGRVCPRATATADQMALAFDSAHRRRLVDGLFLSSGLVSNPDATMTPMIDTISLLRQKYHYRGYVHLKIMPGTSDACIRQALKLSNRLSLNIESPTQANLSTLSPDKDLKNGFFSTLFRLKKAISQAKYFGQKTPSLTTQFIVGATDDRDKDIVHSTALLYQQFGLKRVFYSPFRPVSDTPLSGRPPVSLIRAHRLYQADFLLRFYRFSPGDLCFNSAGLLDSDTDPKTLYARCHRELFPVNLNRASCWQLLKVPGLGPVSVQKIISLRSRQSLFSLSQLSSLRLQLKKITPYINF